MVNVYEYSNIVTEPNMATTDEEGILVGGIKYDVLNGTMTDKSILGCRWDEDTEILKVYFTNTLNSADKSLLDTIVVNNT